MEKKWNICFCVIKYNQRNEFLPNYITRTRQRSRWECGFMRKYTYIVLAAALALSACGNKNVTVDSETTTTVNESEETTAADMENKEDAGRSEKQILMQNRRVWYISSCRLDSVRNMRANGITRDRSLRQIVRRFRFRVMEMNS